MVYQRIFEVRKLKLEFVLGNVFYCEPAFKIFRGLKYAPNCIGERGGTKYKEYIYRANGHKDCYFLGLRSLYAQFSLQIFKFPCLLPYVF